jgi:hypothetical protein
MFGCERVGMESESLETEAVGDEGSAAGEESDTVGREHGGLAA